MKNKAFIIIGVILILLSCYLASAETGEKIGATGEEPKLKTVNLKTTDYIGSVAVFDESTLTFPEGGGSELFYLRQVPREENIINMRMQLEGIFTTQSIGSFNDSYCLSSGATYNAYTSDIITLDVSQINDLGVKARVNCEDKIGVWWVFGSEGEVQCNTTCNPFCKSGSITDFCPPTNAAGAYICDGSNGCGDGCSGGFDKIFNIDTRNQDEITIFLSAWDPGNVYYYSTETRCPGGAWLNVLFTIEGQKYQITYPNDVTIDIGNDGTIDWQWTGKFDRISTPIDIDAAVKEYRKNNCQTDYCDIPVNVTVGGKGIIKIPEISYDIEDRGYIGMAQDNWWVGVILLIIIILILTNKDKITSKNKK